MTKFREEAYTGLVSITNIYLDCNSLTNIGIQRECYYTYTIRSGT